MTGVERAWIRARIAAGVAWVTLAGMVALTIEPVKRRVMALRDRLRGEP